MFRRNRQYYCMNNDYKNNINEMNNDLLENSCQNSCQCLKCNNDDDYVDCCECGFDEEYNVFPENPMLAQSYVPYQYMNRTFKPNIGLKMGTIFPELVSPYSPCQDMREMEYIESTNTIKGGCNKCQ